MSCMFVNCCFFIRNWVWVSFIFEPRMTDLCYLLDLRPTTGSKPRGGSCLGITLGDTWFVVHQGALFVMILFDLFCFFDFDLEGLPRLLEPCLLEPASVVITIGSSGLAGSASILWVEEIFKFWVSNAEGRTNLRFFRMSISFSLYALGSARTGERLIFSCFMYFGVVR